MCGRFLLETPNEDIEALFRTQGLPFFEARFNIAPGQEILAVRAAASPHQRALAHLRWGLVPRWARDPSIGFKTINARSETVESKPSFRDAFRQRRCLIPADGFYEWQREGRHRIPHCFRLKDRSLFAFAGLWERWERAGETIESCTILTTRANDVVQPIHDRMPVILVPEHHALWLDPRVQTGELLRALLRPYPAAAMERFVVSDFVNKVKNEGRRCLESAAPKRESGFLFEI